MMWEIILSGGLGHRGRPQIAGIEVREKKKKKTKKKKNKKLLSVTFVGP